MELVPFKPAAGALVQAGGGADAGSVLAMVAKQQEMLHAQVDQLQSLVVAQCRLTGVNPLAQEMAAGSLSIKIGKKPRDLLNPKAVKFMQSLFALKDTIGKKETREISVLCGVTVTQVREFFTSQRSRVRKFVRLSSEKALRIEETKAQGNVCSRRTELTALDIDAHAEHVEPLRTLEPVEFAQSLSTQMSFPNISFQPIDVPQSSLHPMEVLQNSLQQAEGQQNRSASIALSETMVMQPTDVKINPVSIQKEIKQEEIVPGVELEDKKFLETIFALMRKEETFYGKDKLMKSVSHIKDATLLSGFITMGGLTIVSTWLSEAAVEEQTTVILTIFKVLLHLPLNKALPAEMSAVLQTINRLRFYRTQDISSRARNLLSRLSKVLVRSQALKKPQKDLICKQRIREILSDESWKSEKIEFTDEVVALTDGASEIRKPELKRTPMLLTASAEESNKKGSLQTKSKGKRKVQFVDHPNKKTAGKNAQLVRIASTNNSRPLSADDIQKAKMRAMFMQEKYGKVETSKENDKSQALEVQKTSGVVHSNPSLVPKSPLKSTTGPLDTSQSCKQSIVLQPDTPETSGGSKLNVSFSKDDTDKLDSRRVLWQIPPAVWIDPSWSVGAGDKSKELEVQIQRNKREKETFYASQKDIPLNPKEPWDLEMDFDDSLTPEIPIDQPPEADIMETDSVGAVPANTVAPAEDRQMGSTSSTSVAVTAGTNGAASEPDLELLAVLLKNPQLVFALTSNKMENVTDEQTIALLDTLKRTGLGLSELVNTLASGAALPKEPEPKLDPIPASLPSPTPASDLARAGWRSEYPTQVTAPNLQLPHLSNRGNTPPANIMQQSVANAVSSLPSQPYASVSVLPANIQTNVPPQPQLAVSVNLPIQHVPPANDYLNTASVHQHAQQYALASDPAAVPFHQQPAVNKPVHGLQNISTPAVAHSPMPEPNAYTTFPWESSTARVTNIGRTATADSFASRTTNSYNAVLADALPFANQNAYGNQSSQSGYSSYGTSSVSSQTHLAGTGADRNGYIRSAEYQPAARDGYQRQSKSPELGVARSYGGTQGYSSPQKHWNSGQEGYIRDSSRQWVSSRQSYAAAEPSRQWSSVHQSYTTAEPSRQLSAAPHGYSQSGHGSSSLEASNHWSSSQQGQNQETLRQWNLAKQGQSYPSDGRRSYDHRHWRR